MVAGGAEVNPAAASGLRTVAVIVACLLVQAAVGADLRVAAVAPDLLVLAAVCAGLTAGAHQGLVAGFVAGLMSDLYVTGTPVGLSALVLCLVGYGVGVVRENVLPEGWLLVPLTALMATAAAVITFLLVGDIVGQAQLVAAGRSRLIRVVVVEALWAALLSVPVARLFAWAARGSGGAAQLATGRADGLGLR